MPFYFRAGKCLDTTATEVVAVLEAAAARMFPHRGAPNHLRFRLGPDRVAIALGAAAKQPGAEMAGRDLELLVCNASTDEVGAYERLIGAALHGDPSLFAREDGVLEAWRIVDPLLRERSAPHAYEPGSSGPSAADAFITSSDDSWRPWTTPGAGKVRSRLCAHTAA